MSQTKCVKFSKELTQKIWKNAGQRFLNAFEEMCYKEKMDPTHAQRGLALALAYSTLYFNETRDYGSDLCEIVDEVVVIREKSIKKGVPFSVQAFALALEIPIILGIDYANLPDPKEIRAN